MSVIAPEFEGSENQLPEDDAAQNDPAPKTVPVERFNGLQRAHQDALAKLRTYEAQASVPAKPEAPAVENTDPPESRSVVEDFLADLMTERLENWRERAIKDHPQLEPLREYLTADSKAKFDELVADLAEKLGGSNQDPPSEEADPNVTTETNTPTPPVPGGSPALTPPSGEDELAQLRKHAKETGDWSPLLRKKYELAGFEYPA